MSDPTNNIQPKSSIVRHVAVALDWIQQLSIVYRILKYKGLAELPEGTPRGKADALVDRVVVSCTAVATITYGLSFLVAFSYVINWTVGAVVIILSALRVMDVLSFHLNMVLARPGRPGGVATVASYERSFLLTLLNYLEVTLWFATWYSIAVRSGLFFEAPAPLPLTIFRESLAMMLVNAPSTFTPGASWLLWSAMCFQSLVGLFLTIVIVSRTVSMLPAPTED